MPNIKFTEEELRESLEQWLKENPGKTVNNVSQDTIVTISTGKEIKLGNKISEFRKALKGQGTSKMSELQKRYWVEKHGLSTENQRKKLENENELKYREALEIWLKENPKKTVNDISQDTVVTISMNEQIKLGVKISTLRAALNGKGAGKISESQRK